MRFRIWLFPFLLLLLSLLLQSMAYNEAECDALLQFSNSYTISRYTSEASYDKYPSSITSYQKMASWKNGTDCCKWDGVTCHRSKNFVIGLDLSDSWLQGPLDSNSTLFSLLNLRRLNLAGNDFMGSRISPRFGTFMGMAYLNLSASCFSGPIPMEMTSHLSSLATLDLSSNSGDDGPLTIDDHSFRWLTQNLTQLRELVLDNVDMSRISAISLKNISSTMTSLSLRGCDLRGIFPTDIFHLPNLHSLSLKENRALVGTLPDTNWTSPLVYLDLSDTEFHGPIPTSLGNLTSMNSLDLSYSRFTGEVPPSLGNLHHLTRLALDHNNLRGTVDFEIFARLKNLQALSLGWNNLTVLLQSEGNCSFPSLQILDLSACNMTEFPYFLGSSTELMELDLSGNMISGQIPERLWLVGGDTLGIIDLSSNNLTGEISSSICQLIEYFLLSNNKFHGDIPRQVCNATGLDIIDLSINLLTGTIPHCFINFSASLSVLDLQANKFTGQIPEIFVPKGKLQTIRLSQNQLRGMLPQSLAHCENLEVLDLSENELDGSFPYWLDTLPNLQVLALRSNGFHGPVDGSSRTRRPFPKLRIFDLSENKFCGPLPAKYLANLIAMKNEERGGLQYMGNNIYRVSIAVEMKGSQIELVKILTVFTSIDFSSNFFEGEIPEVIEDLKALKGLNLSHNNLSGNIPSSSGNLINLEWLDLSSNKLDGKIPRGLADLVWLSCLNLSDNQLVGPIPQSTQFSTFSHSFDGNPGLCGRPSPKACGNDPQQRQPSTSHEEEEAEPHKWIEWRAVPMGYGCGLVFGISAGYIVLQTGRPRWLARMVERMGSRKTSRPKQNVTRRNFGRRSPRGH